VKLPQFLRNQIDSGEVTPGVSDLDKQASFISFPFKVERRGIAKDLLEAAAMGYNVYVDKKGNRVVLKTLPLSQNPDISVLLKGKNIDLLGKTNLARNSTNPLRKANARFIEEQNMNELENKAGKLYGRISQANLRDAHHITGINSAARWLKSLDERRIQSFKKMAHKQGLYFGDHPRNLSSIPAKRSINEPNLHQSVIHSGDDPRSITSLLKHFNLPKSTDPKRDFVAPFQNEFNYNSQKEAAALAGLAIERLSVQMTMLNNKNPGSAKAIKDSIELIQKALRNTKPMGGIDERINSTNRKLLIEKLQSINNNASNISGGMTRINSPGDTINSPVTTVTTPI
jgi:hypothetical protein